MRGKIAPLCISSHCSCHNNPVLLAAGWEQWPRPVIYVPTGPRYHSTHCGRRGDHSTLMEVESDWWFPRRPHTCDAVTIVIVLMFQHEQFRLDTGYYLEPFRSSSTTAADICRVHLRVKPGYIQSLPVFPAFQKMSLFFRNFVWVSTFPIITVGQCKEILNHFIIQITLRPGNRIILSKKSKFPEWQHWSFHRTLAHAAVAGILFRLV